MQLDLWLDGTRAEGVLTDARTGRTSRVYGSSDPTTGRFRVASAEGWWRGVLTATPRDDGAALAGGAATRTGRNRFLLDRVAQYARLELRQGRMAATVDYPFFTHPAAQPANRYLQADLLGEQLAFYERGQTLMLDGQLPEEWRSRIEATVVYASPALVSVLARQEVTTGVALPEVDVWSYNLAWLAGRHRPLVLADLFRPGSAYLRTLDRILLEDLRQQGAEWVADGTITTLSPDLLESFTLTPEHLSFHFPPATVGPASQGVFTATVRYERVRSLLGRDGPHSLMAR